MHQAIRKIAGTNLYVMPAGEAVISITGAAQFAGSEFMMDCLPESSTAGQSLMLFVTPACLAPVPVLL